MRPVLSRVLWGRDTSSNIMKVVWLLETLKLPYERRDVGGPFGGTDTQAYRAMNPTGLVPTLQEDGFTLWESNAILRYICAEYAPDNALFPQDFRARADVDRWMDCQQTHLTHPQGFVFVSLIRTPPAGRDPAAIERNVVEAARAWALLEEPLARHPYITGDTLTLADIAWGVHVHRWFTLDIARPPAPHLRAWYDRLLGEPIYAAHVARPLA